jgi:hypothetical protein
MPIAKPQAKTYDIRSFQREAETPVLLLFKNFI